MMLNGFPRITVDPAICGGRATVSGTRMRVTDILLALASGDTAEELVADFPYITAADIAAALAYAAALTERPAQNFV